MPPKFQRSAPPKVSLTYNCRVQFPGKARWVETEFVSRSADSIEVVDPKTFGVRSVLPFRVEFKTVGPRGGVAWVSSSDQDEPDGP